MCRRNSGLRLRCFSARAACCCRLFCSEPSAGAALASEMYCLRGGGGSSSVDCKAPRGGPAPSMPGLKKPPPACGVSGKLPRKACSPLCAAAFAARARARAAAAARSDCTRAAMARLGLPPAAMTVPPGPPRPSTLPPRDGEVGMGPAADMVLEWVGALPRGVMSKGNCPAALSPRPAGELRITPGERGGECTSTPTLRCPGS